MKRINYSLILTSVALIVLLFSCGESEREEATSTANSNTESAETRAESSAPKKVFTGKVYDIVEQMPSFPGGPAELMKWLGSHVQYPAIAQENGVQGRVIVAFVVEKDGSVTDVTVVRSVDPSLDKEAARVVRQMPKWIPGKQNGAAVRVKYNVPVTFKLQ